MDEQFINRTFACKPTRYLVDLFGTVWPGMVSRGYDTLDGATIGAGDYGRVTEVVAVAYVEGLAHTTERVVLQFAPMIEEEDALQILGNLPPGSVLAHGVYSFGRVLSIRLAPDYANMPNRQDDNLDIERDRTGQYRANRRNKTVNAALAIVNKCVRARLKGRA